MPLPFFSPPLSPFLVLDMPFPPVPSPFRGATAFYYPLGPGGLSTENPILVAICWIVFLFDSPS